MKKNDWFIAAAVMITAFLWWGVKHLLLSETGTELTVTGAGKIIGTYSLLQENTITFTDDDGGINVLVIRDGEAVMGEADCPDKLCTKQKEISKKGESIICLPHKLAVEVTKGEDGEVDAIAQ